MSLVTVKSSGEAGKKQFTKMGVYELTGEYHNKKPVWSKYDGTQKIFYDSGKFPFTEMTCNTNIDMTGGGWTIGPDPADDEGNVSTVVSNTNLLPHQISGWQYADGDKWQTDPLLTVTGNTVLLRSLY